MTLADLLKTKAGAAQFGPAPSALPVSTPLKARCVVAQSKAVKSLNKLEAAFYARLQADPAVKWIGVQSITLRLADDCRLTADFVTMDADGQLTFWDVKGFQREDALIKMKFAARSFPMMRFIIVSREAGVWGNRDVEP